MAKLTLKSVSASSLLILFLIFGLNFIFQDSAEPNNNRQPHIILILTDQHRTDALGYAGNPAVITPNFDRLAADGVHFEYGYSSVPSCTPARAALLTGQAPWKNGMLGYGRLAREYEFQMPQMLRDLGYYSFGIGKMHWFPQKALHGFHGTLVDESGRIESEGFISDYRNWFKLNAPGQDPDQTGIGWNEHRAGVYQLDEELHPTVWTGQTAVELIDAYDLDAPLFLKISFARPHSPYDPPQRYLDMYQDVEIPAPPAGYWAEKFVDFPETPNAAFGDFGADHAINSRRHYYALVTQIDDQIGEIVQALKQNGMYDNSLIVFTSDHGDMLGDHHHWRKTYAYEGSAGVPFLLKWPQSIQGELDRGSVLSHPVELRDILPTFLDAAGSSVPEEMDGQSLLELVANPRADWRPWIDLEHAATYIEDNYWSALTDGEMKYIWFFRTGEEQLFNMAEDPQELVNLAGREEYREELERWRSRLGDHLSERGEGFAKDGVPVMRDESKTYSPNYPQIEMTQQERLQYWIDEITGSFQW
jgi:arylsulfatase